MSVMQHAHAAYSHVAIATKSDRSIEFDVIANVTAKLTATKVGDFSYPRLAEAVDANRRMWATIASSVADTDNTYPDELKAGLFYLAEFTTHHSRKVLAGDASLDALIEVNKSVLRGLKGSATT